MSLLAADNENSDFFSGAKHRDPFCFVSGSIRSVNKDEKKIEPKSEMIRLRFEAESLEICKKSIISHCENVWRLGGFYPFRIKIKYRRKQDSKWEYDYVVKTDCTLTEEELKSTVE